jgi:hypothetical protein
VPFPQLGHFPKGFGVVLNLSTFIVRKLLKRGKARIKRG